MTYILFIGTTCEETRKKSLDVAVDGHRRRPFPLLGDSLAAPSLAKACLLNSVIGQLQGSIHSQTGVQEVD